MVRWSLLWLSFALAACSSASVNGKNESTLGPCPTTSQVCASQPGTVCCQDTADDGGVTRACFAPDAAPLGCPTH